MSIKEKLKSLIRTIEELDIDDELEGILEEDLEEELEEEVVETSEEEDVFDPDELEVPFEDCISIATSRERVVALKHDLGIALHNWERQKIHVLNEIARLEELMRDEVESLREEVGLPEDANYTFTIPDEPGQPGLFKKS